MAPFLLDKGEILEGGSIQVRFGVQQDCWPLSAHPANRLGQRLDERRASRARLPSSRGQLSWTRPNPAHPTQTSAGWALPTASTGVPCPAPCAGGTSLPSPTRRATTLRRCDATGRAPRRHSDTARRGRSGTSLPGRSLFCGTRARGATRGPVGAPRDVPAARCLPATQQRQQPVRRPRAGGASTRERAAAAPGHNQRDGGHPAQHADGSDLGRHQLCPPHGCVC